MFYQAAHSQLASNCHRLPAHSFSVHYSAFVQHHLVLVGIATVAMAPLASLSCCALRRPVGCRVYCTARVFLVGTHCSYQMVRLLPKKERPDESRVGKMYGFVCSIAAHAMQCRPVAVFSYAASTSLYRARKFSDLVARR